MNITIKNIRIKNDLEAMSIIKKDDNDHVFNGRAVYFELYVKGVIFKLSYRPGARYANGESDQMNSSFEYDSNNSSQVMGIFEGMDVDINSVTGKAKPIEERKGRSYKIFSLEDLIELKEIIDNFEGAVNKVYFGPSHPFAWLSLGVNNKVCDGRSSFYSLVSDYIGEKPYDPKLALQQATTLLNELL